MPNYGNFLKVDRTSRVIRALYARRHVRTPENGCFQSQGVFIRRRERCEATDGGGNVRRTSYAERPTDDSQRAAA